MNRVARFLRSLAKITVWSLAACVAAVLAWFAANRLLDESPDPRRETFLAAREDQIPDDQNAAVGILGLTAPRGSDFVQYGVRIKALYVDNGPWDQIRDMLTGPNTLQPTVESGEVTCWLDPDGAALKGCLPFDQALTVLEQNRELLERYRALFRLRRYVNVNNPFNRASLVVARLSVAEMQLDLRRGNRDAAYRKWRDQMLFVRRNLRGPDTWVGKAVGLVVLGMTLPVLEDLLLANPKVAKEHAAELMEILRPEGIEAFNPEGIVRAEFSTLDKFLASREAANRWPAEGLDWLALQFGQKNRMLNRSFAFAREYAPALRLPWEQVDAEFDRLRKSHVASIDWGFALDPFGTLFLENYIEGQLKARVMLHQMHFTDGRLRLATLLVRILHENVRDPDIPRFLESVGSGFRDPFSAAPMQWDAKNRQLYFPDPKERCSIIYMRVPTLSQSGSASAPPRTGAWVC
jgi:hypothetical protein